MDYVSESRKDTDDARSSGRRNPRPEPCQAPRRDGGGWPSQPGYRRRRDVHAARPGARDNYPCLIRLVERLRHRSGRLGDIGQFSLDRLRFRQFRLGQFEQRPQHIDPAVSQQRLRSGDVGRILNTGAENGPASSALPEPAGPTMSERTELRGQPGERMTNAETTDPELTVELGDDYVATLEINRPPSNHFSVGLIEKLADACEELATGQRCRAIVLCSAGRVFCAGADFSDNHAIGRADGMHLYDFATRLFEQPLPIVAAVQGAAIGGGLGLALAADFRVAAPEARFAANFALLGIHQGFALSVTLPAIVGQQKALELLYTGRRIAAAEAHAIGLADRLADSGRAREEAHALAAEIAASAPLAIRSIRATMRGSLPEQARAAMERERGEQERLMQTSDWREGLAAVSARRPANFTGR